MALKSKRVKRPSYLREIQILYKQRRVSSKSSPITSIRGASQVFELFSELQNETKEKLITINLDARLKIICFEVVAIGSVNTLLVKPFEVIRSSVALNAHGIIVVHNHPSGDSTPSSNDKKFTRALKKITDLGGLVFHDHIIIGQGDYYSFAKNQLLAS